MYVCMYVTAASCVIGSQDILEAAVSGQLSATEFPVLPESQHANTDTTTAAQPTRAWKKTGTTASTASQSGETRKRVIVFIAGGIAYNEIRTVHEIAAANPSFDIYLGSHDIWTAQDALTHYAAVAKPHA
eukprot:m.109347 g.109347  ORF g.109347 m.109347 type:complete len:130 (+) comp51763_c0_seq1:3-392(+)